MNRVYIVHCWEGTKDDGWYPWLDDKISDDETEVFRFNMPNTDAPEIESWCLELNKQVGELDENTFFVGHSIGCQTIMRYLERQNARKIGGILFVAPWLKLLPKAVEDDESYNIAQPWLNTPIDFQKVRSFTDNITCIFSDDDYFVPIEQEKVFKEVLGARTVVVEGKGHISADDGVNELDEICKELKRLLERKED